VAKKGTVQTEIQKQEEGDCVLKKTISLVANEDVVDTLLGCCKECGWKRGEPVIAEGPKGVFVRVKCKGHENGQKLVKPVRVSDRIQNHIDCPRKKKELERRKELHEQFREEDFAVPRYADGMFKRRSG
jgi:hypothetical protein